MVFPTFLLPDDINYSANLIFCIYAGATALPCAPAQAGAADVGNALNLREMPSDHEADGRCRGELSRQDSALVAR